MLETGALTAVPALCFDAFVCGARPLSVFSLRLLLLLWRGSTKWGTQAFDYSLHCNVG